jgi:hypothetical protein
VFAVGLASEAALHGFAVFPLPAFPALSLVPGV